MLARGNRFPRERAKIEFERFRFDGRVGFRGNPQLADGERRLAGRLEPGNLVGGPEIGACERQLVEEPERFALRRALDREKQARILPVRVAGRLAQR